jgi:hypothetical protein
MNNAPLFSGGRIAVTLAPLASGGADAGQIAEASVAIWGAIDRALSPVIGQRGSIALYRRTLHLVRSDYLWLATAYEAAADRGEFEALRSALMQQTPEHAAAAHDSMLQTFLDLIGESLTHRLLQAAWEPPSSGHAAQDTSP